MFYTYLWLREDGTPYYVGKGHGDRAYTRVGHKQKPPSIGRMVFYIARDEAEAFENEIALIWYYGRKDLGTGCLRNLTDGGEGFTGKHTDETRLKISQNNVRYWSGKTPPAPSADNIEKRSKALQGNKNSLGFVHTKESIQKRIASLQQNLKYKVSVSAVRQRSYVARLKAEGKERLGKPEPKSTAGAIRQRRYILRKVLAKTFGRSSTKRQNASDRLRSRGGERKTK
jgi:hypothetical protein